MIFKRVFGGKAASSSGGTPHTRGQSAHQVEECCRDEFPEGSSVVVEILTRAA